MNMIEKCFLVQNMDEYRNTMLHQILSDCHLGTLSKSKKKGLVHFNFYKHNYGVVFTHYDIFLKQIEGEKSSNWEDGLHLKGSFSRKSCDNSRVSSSQFLYLQ